MNLKRYRLRLEDLQLINAVVLAIWIANTAIIWFLLTKIDSIVNVQLYYYGLQFNYEWANQYWAILRLMFLFLGLPVALGLFALSLGILRMRKTTEDTAPQTKTLPQPPQETPKTTLDFKKETLQRTETKTKQVTNRPQDTSELEKTKDLLTHCPNCGKITDRPLVKLDFSGGKIQLVSICPYCNHVIGEISTKKDNPAKDKT